MGLEGLDLIGQVGVGGGEGGVDGNQLLKDSFVVGGGAGEVVEGIVNGSEEAGGLVGSAGGIVSVVDAAGAGVNNPRGGLVGTA